MTEILAEPAADPAPEGPVEPHASATATHDIVVVGASTGGIDALRRLAASLPASYGGSLCVAMHVPAEARSELPGILARAGPLPAVRAEDGMALRPGRIHVAPPNHHLLVERGRLRVVHGPRENRHRPAIDPLFRSAAWVYGPRVVGVVLTGNLDDGTAGLWAIKTCGGTTIVQEPTTARPPEMPLHALMHHRIDHRVPLEAIGALLVRLASEPVAVQAAPRPPSPMKDACSQDPLVLDQGRMVEQGLFSALRAVEEKAVALRRLAERPLGPYFSAKEGYEARAGELDHTAAVLRTLLSGQVRTPYVPGTEPAPEPEPPA